MKYFFAPFADLVKPGLKSRTSVGFLVFLTWSILLGTTFLGGYIAGSYIVVPLAAALPVAFFSYVNWLQKWETEGCVGWDADTPARLKEAITDIMYDIADAQRDCWDKFRFKMRNRANTTLKNANKSSSIEVTTAQHDKTGGDSGVLQRSNSFGNRTDTDNYGDKYALSPIDSSSDEEDTTGTWTPRKGLHDSSSSDEELGVSKPPSGVEPSSVTSHIESNGDNFSKKKMKMVLKRTKERNENEIKAGELTFDDNESPNDSGIVSTKFLSITSNEAGVTERVEDEHTPNVSGFKYHLGSLHPYSMFLCRVHLYIFRHPHFIRVKVWRLDFARKHLAVFFLLVDGSSMFMSVLRHCLYCA